MDVLACGYQHVAGLSLPGKGLYPDVNGVHQDPFEFAKKEGGGGP